MAKTVKDSLAEVDAFLAVLPKEAGVTTETDFNAKEKQTNLGKEQTAAAKDSGSTIDNVENSDKDAKQPYSETLAKGDPDQLPATKLGIGKKKEEYKASGDLTEKTAAFEKAANDILDGLKAMLEKSAGENPRQAEEKTVNLGGTKISMPEAKPEVKEDILAKLVQLAKNNPEIAAAIAGGTAGAGIGAGVADKKLKGAGVGAATGAAAGAGLGALSRLLNKKASDELFQKLAAESAAYAQDAFESHLAGKYLRLQHEAAIQNSPELQQKYASEIKQCGGISQFLQKVAEDMPEAILPEPEGAANPDVAADAAGAHAEPDADNAAVVGAEAEGAAPEGMDQLLAALDQAGVTEEDIVKAFEDLKKLEEAGVSPEELSQAVGGMIQEGDAVPEKTAAEKTKIDLIKDFLRTR